MSTSEVIWIDNPAAVARLAEELVGVRELCLDTEADSMYRYRARLCFVQLQAAGRIFLIDTLAAPDLSPLAPMMADPSVTKVFHGADFDLMILKRKAGFHFANIFDTMVASQFLNREALGLAALVANNFGVTLDKAYQKFDWGKRPLFREHLEYLSGDVRYLSELRARIARDLAQEGLLEVTRLEFDRMADVLMVEESLDPEGFRRIKGARELDQVGLSILRELFLLREELARDADRPPFKIMGNDALLGLSHHRPIDPAIIRRTANVPAHVFERIGERLMEALRVGERNAENIPLRLPAPPRQPDSQVAINEGLRAWRKQRAESERKAPVAILPNHAIERIAAARPTDSDALAATPYLGLDRVVRYGDEILEVTRNPPSLESLKRGRFRRRSAVEYDDATESLPGLDGPEGSEAP